MTVDAEQYRKSDVHMQRIFSDGIYTAIRDLISLTQSNFSNLRAVLLNAALTDYTESLAQAEMERAKLPEGLHKTDTTPPQSRPNAFPCFGNFSKDGDC